MHWGRTGWPLWLLFGYRVLNRLKPSSKMCREYAEALCGSLRKVRCTPVRIVEIGVDTSVVAVRAGGVGLGEILLVVCEGQEGATVVKVVV